MERWSKRRRTLFFFFLKGVCSTTGGALGPLFALQRPGERRFFVNATFLATPPGNGRKGGGTKAPPVARKPSFEPSCVIILRGRRAILTLDAWGWRCRLEEDRESEGGGRRKIRDGTICTVALSIIWKSRGERHTPPPLSVSTLWSVSTPTTSHKVVSNLLCVIVASIAL